MKQADTSENPEDLDNDPVAEEDPGDEPGLDEDDPGEDSGDDRESASPPTWTALIRYATPQRTAEVEKVLEAADIHRQIDLEGRATGELDRIRVKADDLDEAVEALFKELGEGVPETPESRRFGGLMGGMRKRREIGRASIRLQEFLDQDDRDGAIDTLWYMTAIEPDDDSVRRHLVDLLIERGGKGDHLLARWWVEEMIRRHGVGKAAAEMAGIAVEEGSLDEAEAWLNEAGLSGADPAEIAFERCNLAFARGVVRDLKQAAGEFRRTCDVPDANWIEVAALLAAAGEIDRAGQMLGTTLRDAPGLGEHDWALAAALRMVAEGPDTESRGELADLVGDDEAADLEDEAADWIKELRKEWKEHNERSKKEKKRGKERGRDRNRR